MIVSIQKRRLFYRFFISYLLEIHNPAAVGLYTELVCPFDAIMTEECISVIPASRVSETWNKIREQKETFITARTKAFRHTLEPFLYLLPAAVVFAGFVFYPFFKTLYISLFLTNPEGEIGRVVELKNYAAVFTSPEYLNSILVTLKFVILTVPAELVIGFVLAVFANVQLKGIAVFRTLYALPIAISSASAAVIWMLLFNPGSGWINYLLGLRRPSKPWTTRRRASTVHWITTIRRWG